MIDVNVSPVELYNGVHLILPNTNTWCLDQGFNEDGDADDLNNFVISFIVYADDIMPIPEDRTLYKFKTKYVHIQFIKCFWYKRSFTVK